jgi:hypothetical protein
LKQHLPTDLVADFHKVPGIPIPPFPLSTLPKG